MLAFGFSLNLLTLLTLVLAIGLVVDDAIVAVENIHRNLEKRISPVQEALIGAPEMVTPGTARTITCTPGSATNGLMGGQTGVLVRELALTLAGPGDGWG